jgi:hypothetical protein
MARVPGILDRHQPDDLLLQPRKCRRKPLAALDQIFGDIGSQC